MKCPYAVSRCQVTQTTIKYDDNGNQVGFTEVQNNNAEFVDCLRENCGAFNKETNKCEYHS